MKRLWCWPWFLAGLLACGSFLSCHRKPPPPPQPCVNKIHATEDSPDGRLKAVVFYRQCPDEGTTSTQISVLPKGQPLPDSNGNVFADRDLVSIRVAWLTSTQLAVYSFADLSKATKTEKLGSTSIEYDQAMETDLVPPVEQPSASPSQRGTP